MLLDRGLGHLGYCTNIHPGESWAEVRRNVDQHVLAVKRRICPERPFGVGLRLSGRAAVELGEPAALEAFTEQLRSTGLYVFTVNAFPYGVFHGTPVKENVYRPDWLEPERLAYTDRVAALLAHLVRHTPAAGGEASISTVPGCFRPRAQEPGARASLAAAMAQAASTLWRVRESDGVTLRLAIEPEPECALETVAETLKFLTEEVYAGPGLRAFEQATGLSPAAAEASLRQHLGLCLDACHAAVEFEDPGATLAAIRTAGVGVYKLQVSTGLHVPEPDAERLAALSAFAEGVYLHQVVIRDGDQLTRFLDLPEALAERATCHPSPDEQWRVHFHVPLFRRSLGPFENTQDHLLELLRLQAEAPFTRHLEVETYTWDVLPPEFRNQPVAEAIERELRFTLGALGAAA